MYLSSYGNVSKKIEIIMICMMINITRFEKMPYHKKYFDMRKQKKVHLTKANLAKHIDEKTLFYKIDNEKLLKIINHNEIKKVHSKFCKFKCKNDDNSYFGKCYYDFFISQKIDDYDYGKDVICMKISQGSWEDAICSTYVYCVKCKKVYHKLYHYDGCYDSEFIMNEHCCNCLNEWTIKDYYDCENPDHGFNYKKVERSPICIPCENNKNSLFLLMIKCAKGHIHSCFQIWNVMMTVKQFILMNDEVTITEYVENYKTQKKKMRVYKK